MALKISDIENHFWSDYREIVKLDDILKKIMIDDLPLEFILNKLDGIKNNLQDEDHEINFILIEKSNNSKDIQNRKIFDNLHSVLYGYEIRTLKIFYENFSIDEIYETFYKQGFFISLKEPAEKELLERKNRIIEFISNIRRNLSSLDVYLWKSDVDSLVDDFSSDDNTYIKYNHYLDGDRSSDYKELKETEEFETSGACDLAFDLWRKDKDNFIKRLKSKRDNDYQIELNKEVSGKSETSYLNIIQALKDELLNGKERFKNQDDLVKFLSDKYIGYTGLSETNLREKFAKANKIQ